MSNQSSKDHYDTLGVTAEAPKDEIKKAYRAMARKYHPDTRGDDVDEAEAEAKIREITSAYEVLGDDELKRAYDQWQVSGEGSDAEEDTEFSEGDAETSRVRYTVNVTKAEAEATGFMKQSFTDWAEFSGEEDVYDSMEGDLYRMNTRMKGGDKTSFSRSYEVKMDGKWHDIDSESGQVWGALRQWRDLMETLIFKSLHYKKEGGYAGDLGDIETAFENLNLFLFSRAYQATTVWLNQASDEGGFRGFEGKEEVCEYKIHDFDESAQAQRYYAEHANEMPTPPVDPNRKKRIIFGDEGDTDSEGDRARIIFGEAMDAERSDGINIPSEGDEDIRIVWGDEGNSDIKWGVQDETGIV